MATVFIKSGAISYQIIIQLETDSSRLNNNGSFSGGSEMSEIILTIQTQVVNISRLIIPE